MGVIRLGLGLGLVWLLGGCIPTALHTEEDRAAIAGYAEESQGVEQDEKLSETDVILMGLDACKHREESGSLKSAAESYARRYRKYTSWQSQTMFRVGLDAYCPEHGEK